MAIAEDFNLNSISISLGDLEVRLAENNVEIDAAQALRYKVFFEEMKAKPTPVSYTHLTLPTILLV